MRETHCGGEAKMAQKKNHFGHWIDGLARREVVRGPRRARRERRGPRAPRYGGYVGYPWAYALSKWQMEQLVRFIATRESEPLDITMLRIGCCLTDPGDGPPRQVYLVRGRGQGETSHHAQGAQPVGLRRIPMRRICARERSVSSRGEWSRYVCYRGGLAIVALSNK